MKGRNFASHPFILSAVKSSAERTKNLSLNLLLAGRANKYLSYFYYALDKAGREGILRERMPYTIESIYTNGISLKDSDDKIRIIDAMDNWQLNSDLSSQKHLKLLIHFETPLRYKEKGKFQDTISYPGLLKIIKRRVEILSVF